MKYIISTLLGLSLAGGTALASSNSLPGSWLYPVKLATEKIELQLTLTAQGKAEVRAKHAAERLEELAKLEKQNQSAEVKAQAKTDAKIEVNNAIQTLSEVKAKLEAKGNLNAAASLGQNILRLQNKASEVKIDIRNDLDVNTEIEKADENKDKNDSGLNLRQGVRAEGAQLIKIK